MTSRRLAAGLAAIDRLRDRALVLSSSQLPHDLDAIMTMHRDISGLITVGTSAPRAGRLLKSTQPWLVLGHDSESSRAYMATAEAPFVLPADETLTGPVSLSDQIDYADKDLDAILSPTGTIRAKDDGALEAALAGCEAIHDQRLVCSLPIEPDWLCARGRARLIKGIQSSTHLIALSVVCQLDPFQNVEVAEGLLALTAACGGKVLLHRADMAGIQYLARGGLATTVAGIAGLRHCVPPLRRSRTRRKRPRSGAAVWVPGIDEFRDVSEVRRWYGATAPYCALPHCCGRKLTDFDPANPDDVALLSAHNLRGPLAVVDELRGQPDRRAWLWSYRAQVTTAYDELRSRTKDPAIEPYGSAQFWLAQTD